MGLCDLVGRVWNRGKSAVDALTKAERDTLSAVLVPKKLFTDRSYKDERGLVKEDIGNYFDSCAVDIGKAIAEAYGDSFDQRKEQMEGATKYTFTRGNITITYCTQRIGSWESSDGERFSNELAGMLFVQQPSLDLQKASTLLQRSLETHLLDRQLSTGKYGVFYHPSASTVAPQDGELLLGTMGIQPTEAAQFVGVMYYGSYQHEVFTKERAA